MSFGPAILQLFVTDIDRACRWFAALGFAEVFRHGAPPFYAQVARDAARLNLRQLDALPFDTARAAAEEWLAASILVGDAAEAFAACAAAGATLQTPLRRQPWGAQDFVVRDPDGNLLLFAGPG